MARKARVLSPNGLYCIELKGERLFLRHEDKEKFLEIAGECFADGKIYGAFLSDTLIKMVVKTDNISAVMKSLSIKYARYINKLAQTSGRIFSGRFKSEPIASEADAKNAAKALSADEPRANPKRSEPETRKRSAPAKAGKSARDKAPAVPEAAAEKRTKKKPDRKNLPSWLL